MRKIKVGEIILDYTFYPRTSVDMVHVGYIKTAIQAGATLPPIVVCAKSLRAIDGFHRCKSYASLYGMAHLVDVVEKKYRNEAEMLADAIRYNANHGRVLTRQDRVHCLFLAERWELTLDEAASAMSMTMEAMTELRADRMATTLSGPNRRAEPVALKATIRHMRGQTLTQAQVETNSKLSGMNQLFYVNQIIALIESDLIDTANQDLMEKLKKLASLIRGLKKSAA